MKTLILGGIRSGKSRLAEALAVQSGLEVTYLATALAGDAEMCRRIEQHRARRPPEWTVIEAPYTLAAGLQRYAGPERCLLIECLTLWLTNLLCCGDEVACLSGECEALLNTLPGLPGHIILVGNETSMGIVPLGELSRRYGDEAGLLHQRLAGLCDRVILTVAGLPWVLKGKAL